MEHQLLDAPLSEEERKDMADGKGIHVQYLPGTFIPVANKSNDYLIDRQAQREQRSFSGVEGFSMQDASLQESMGPIQDHEAEHLVPTDKAIMMARRKLAEYAASIDEKTGTARPEPRDTIRARGLGAARPHDGCNPVGKGRVAGGCTGQSRIASHV
ncbi:MAG: phthalate 4,5-dioxygenase [Burkholderiales bacterium]